MRTLKNVVHLGLIATFVGSLVLVAAVTTATADPQGRDDFVVDVPFAFVAGDRTLPAGSYRVELLPNDTDPEVLATLESTASDHFPQMIFQSVALKNVTIEPLGPNEVQPRLVFAKVGTLRILREIEAE